MDHQYLKHRDCELMHCHICDGGLAVCTVCKGAEGSLPTECPGLQMSAAQQEAVYQGHMDYQNGKWVKL